jgi:ribonucleoside-triphosphate reductase
MAVKGSGKKRFVEKLLALGEKGPLSLLAMDRDGSPYLRMHRASFLIGMVGLNELVQIHTGQEMHQSKNAFKFGLKVIAHMKLLIEKFSEHYGMRFVLEQTPAESTAYRFAKLDLRYHSPESGRIVRYIQRENLLYELHVSEQYRCPQSVERVRQEGPA